MQARPRPSRRRERLALAAIAGFAALRVSALAAAFPFFTNVDEHRHVDMVLKYARAALPRPDAVAYEPDMPRLVAWLGAPDYQLPPGAVSTAAPGWAVSPDELERRIARNEVLFAHLVNLDTHESPPYYALAGAWFALAERLGVDPVRALYSVRLWNALFAALLVVCAFVLVRRTHPGDALLCWGVPLLLASFPQDTFYYVTPDAFSALAGAVAFALTLRLLLDPESGLVPYALAGAVAAVAVLTKPPNVYVLGVALAAALGRARLGRRLLGRFALYASACALPVGAWLLRNHVLQGDWLGTSSKTLLLGWRPNPVSEWLAHPLFTPRGFTHFVLDLVPRFWRGELVWRRRELAWPFADAVYTATTIGFLAVGALALARRRSGPARTAELASAASLAASVAILALLSLLFVFPPEGNPSAERPWFHHGRLIAGALLPFAILYLRGLEVLAAALPVRARAVAAWSALALLLALCVGSELWLSLPAFRSPYNLYHHG